MGLRFSWTVARGDGDGDSDRRPGDASRDASLAARAGRAAPTSRRQLLLGRVFQHLDLMECLELLLAFQEGLTMGLCFCAAACLADNIWSFLVCCSYSVSARSILCLADCGRPCQEAGCPAPSRIPDLPEKYREVIPGLKFGPRPRPFGLLLMPFILYVYFEADRRKAAFRNLDTDRDKRVTLSEFQASGGTGQRFTALDGDRDGALSEKEYFTALFQPDA
ncbi:unnamed protein product [Prorocentrum cordatum]|uniref:Calmodulin n=1 Tax=Prorocentrum cordatum TaxID=2364126 RepID=A0ABN9TMU4_9DINO|nr:unnamed protein product [Polarella glacialis]